MMGVVGMLPRQKHAVILAECSLEHSWLSIQQNAVIDKVKSVGCLLWVPSMCCVCRLMQPS